jgi:hypothetical protein
VKKSIFIYLLFAAIIFIIGCAKDGETGPAGADGVNGANGTNGTNGINGTNGSNGNANVSQSNFTVNGSDWTYNNLPVWDQSLTVILNDNDITQNIIDSGIVMVYLSLNSPATEWFALPFTQKLNGNYLSQTWAFAYSLNNVTIKFYFSDGSSPSTPSTNYFKVVVISGTQRIANPNVNWNNYQEVKAFLNLSETK